MIHICACIIIWQCVVERAYPPVVLECVPAPTCVCKCEIWLKKGNIVINFEALQVYLFIAYIVFRIIKSIGYVVLCTHISKTKLEREREREREREESKLQGNYTPTS